MPVWGTRPTKWATSCPFWSWASKFCRSLQAVTTPAQTLACTIPALPVPSRRILKHPEASCSLRLKPELVCSSKCNIYWKLQVLADESLKCWGENGWGQLGHGSTDSVQPLVDPNLPKTLLGSGVSVMKVAAGGWHTCAILQDETLKCWGRNLNGEP